MSLLNQQNNNDKKKGGKKSKGNAKSSKFIVKPGRTGSFTNKQSNTGAQRGS